MAYTIFYYVAGGVLTFFVLTLVFFAIKLRREEKQFKKVASRQLRKSISKEIDYESKLQKRQ